MSRASAAQEAKAHRLPFERCLSHPDGSAGGWAQLEQPVTRDGGRRQSAPAVDGETGEAVPVSDSASTAASDWTVQQDDSDSSEQEGPTYEQLDDARRRYLQVERVRWNGLKRWSGKEH